MACNARRRLLHPRLELGIGEQQRTIRVVDKACERPAKPVVFPHGALEPNTTRRAIAVSAGIRRQASETIPRWHPPPVRARQSWVVDVLEGRPEPLRQGF